MAEDVYEKLFGKVQFEHLSTIEAVIENESITNKIDRSHLKRITNAVEDMYENIQRVERLISEAGIEDVSPLMREMAASLEPRHAWVEDTDITFSTFTILFELTALRTPGVTGGVVVDRQPTDAELETIRLWLVGYQEAELSQWSVAHTFSDDESIEIHTEVFNQIQDFLVTIGFRIVNDKKILTVRV